MAAINRSTDMTTGSIWKRMVSFAVPVFLGNLCQQLYNTVDSVIVGRLWPLWPAAATSFL